MKATLDDVANVSVLAGLIVAIAFAAFCVGTLVVKAATADGTIDYCWVDQSTYYYTLIGHRSWRPDASITHTMTLDEALRAAAASGCRVGRP